MNTHKTDAYLEELLSFSSNTNAHSEALALSEKYGKLSYIIQLDDYTLEKSAGCSSTTACFLRLAVGLTSRRITDKYKFGKKYLQNDIKEYICGLLLGASVETIYMLLLDESEKLIGCEYVGEGTVNSSGVLPRKLIDCAVRRGAKTVILAHNHPCGNAHPSDDDLNVTSLLRASLSNAGINLSAHYVVAGFNITDCVGTVAK